MLRVNHFDDAANSIKNEFENIQIPKIPDYIIYSIIGFIVLVIIIIIYVQYKKYRTRQLYNESPEHFSHKPDLNIFQNFTLNNTDFLCLSPSQNQTIEKKQNYDGVYYQVKVHDKPSCICFDHVIKENAYFQIQIIQLKSIVQIGYIHKEDFQALYKLENQEEGGEQGNVTIELDKLGVSLNTDGAVILYGENKHPYRWNLQYGDVIGIAITESKTEKRCWVSKNGVLMNPANNEQMLKNIDVSKQDKQEKGDFEPKKKKQQEGKEEDEEQRKQKQEEELKVYARKKLQMKGTKSMKYYPIIVSQKSQGETIINVNIGGQIFRMYDQSLMGGILV